MALSVLAGCLAMMSSSAYAHVEAVAGTKVGLQPREVARYWTGDLEWNGRGKRETEPNTSAENFNNNPNDPNHPGPVMHSVATYAIYWDPQDYYHGDWQGPIDGFLANLGSASGQLSSVFAIDEQYTDATNKPAPGGSAFRGAYTDTNPYPESENCTDPHEWEFGVPTLMSGEPVCLTDKQIRAQLKTFISEQHGLPKGMGTIYYVLTPPGVTVCLDGGGSTGHCSDFEGTIAEIETDEKDKTEPTAFHNYKQSFCSYHSDIDPSGESGGPETVLYAVIPWIAGGAGDEHLTRTEWTQGYDCQDGGFEPGIKPDGELQEKELEPKEQEPNQLGIERGPDGSFDHGLADLIINQIAVEQQDTITDPLLNGWQDSAGNEATDECRNSFFATTSGSVTANPWTLAGTLSNQTLEGGAYYLNDAFNLAALRVPYPGSPCLHDVALEPHFTAPNTVKSGETVGFDGMESNITLDSAYGFISSGATKANYPTYTWNFGDGSPEVSGYAPGAPSKNSPETSPCAEPWLSPCAASTFHTYEYGGAYNVTLTVKDVGGNTASFTEAITVERPGAARRRLRRLERLHLGRQPRRVNPRRGRSYVLRRHDQCPRPGPRGQCGRRGELAEARPRARVWLSATRSTSRWPAASKCCSPRRSHTASACTFRSRAVCPPARRRRWWSAKRS